MTMPAYPLLEVLQVKIRRVENQEMVVKQKREALENEKKKLAEREAARDKFSNTTKINSNNCEMNSTQTRLLKRLK